MYREFATGFFDCLNYYHNYCTYGGWLYHCCYFYCRCCYYYHHYDYCFYYCYCYCYSEVFLFWGLPTSSTYMSSKGGLFIIPIIYMPFCRFVARLKSIIVLGFLQSFEEAIEINNEVSHGLSSSVFTNSQEHIFKWMGFEKMLLHFFFLWSPQINTW